MTKVSLEQIKLANAVKIGRGENVLFQDKGNFRDHGTRIEMVAVKMPIENAPGEYVTQPLVKLTDKQSHEVTYTSLMNTIYFQGELDLMEQPVKPKRGRPATVNV